MKIPKSYDKISIEQGVALGKIPSLNLERLDTEIQVLHILTGKPVELFESMPFVELEKLIKKTDWVNTPPQPKDIKPFFHRFRRIKFRTLAKDISHQDFVLLQKYAQSPDDLHNVLAILAIRKGAFKDYIKEHEYKANLFLKKLSFGTAYGYMLFFSLYYPIYLDTILSYSIGQMKAIRKTRYSDGLK